MDRNRPLKLAIQRARPPAFGLATPGEVSDEPIAIVGMAAHFGSLSDLSGLSAAGPGRRPSRPAGRAEALVGPAANGLVSRPSSRRSGVPGLLPRFVPPAGGPVSHSAPRARGDAAAAIAHAESGRGGHRGCPLESGPRTQDGRAHRPGSGSEHGKLPASLAAGQSGSCLERAIEARPCPAPG